MIIQKYNFNTYLPSFNNFEASVDVLKIYEYKLVTVKNKELFFKVNMINDNCIGNFSLYYKNVKYGFFINPKDFSMYYLCKYNNNYTKKVFDKCFMLGAWRENFRDNEEAIEIYTLFLDVYLDILDIFKEKNI